jgi:hypothetical protein
MSDKDTVQNTQTTGKSNADDADVQESELLKKEIGGRDGPEPTRYGDWEKNGIISDF